MGLHVTTSPGIELRRFLNDERQLDVIERATKTATPTLEQLDRLLHTRELPTRDREWMQALLDVVRKTGQQASGAISRAGVVRPHELQIQALGVANRARADSPVELDMQARLSTAAIGQPQVVQAFVDVARDFHAPQRFSPPLLAICGPPGHGTGPVVEHFARALSGQPPLRCDLSMCTAVTDDAMAALLFGVGGPLNIDTLTAAAAGGTSVVHLVGVNDLQQRAPQAAAALTALLNADRDDVTATHYVRLAWVVEFPDSADGTTAAAAAEAALGDVAHRKLTAEAQFMRLDAPALQQYAKASLARRFQANAALSKLVLRYDDTALRVLGQALATPFAPLDELEDRLRTFVLQRFDVHALQHPDRAVLKLQVAEPFASDPRLLQRRLDELHVARPDLRAAADLFMVAEVGVVAGVDDHAARLRVGIEAVDAAIVRTALADVPDEDALSAALTALREHAAALRAVVAAVSAAPKVLERAIRKANTTGSAARAAAGALDDHTSSIVVAALDIAQPTFS